MNVNEYVEIEIERSMIEKSERPDCKNAECGGTGDGWGSLGGYCVRCKHTNNVGCKCILEGCVKIYWAKTMAEKKIANKRGRA
tara:strand:- start:355 stop:603 length:249 start_codon:yes stop_codon:yes gene_type:complete